MKKSWFKLNPTGWLFIIGSIFTFATPFLFSQNWLTWITAFDDNTSDVGGTIGGITSPFVGLLVGWITYKAFKEQLIANKIQSDLIKQNNDQKLKDDFLKSLEGIEKSLDKIQTENHQHKGINAISTLIVNFHSIREVILELKNDNNYGNIFQAKIESLVLKSGLSTFRLPSIDNNEYPLLGHFIRKHEFGFSYYSKHYVNKFPDISMPNFGPIEEFVNTYFKEKKYHLEFVNIYKSAQEYNPIERIFNLNNYYYTVKSVCNKIDIIINNEKHNINTSEETISDLNIYYLDIVIQNLSIEEMTIIFLKFIELNDLEIGKTFGALISICKDNSYLIPDEYKFEIKDLNAMLGSISLSYNFSVSKFNIKSKYNAF